VLVTMGASDPAGLTLPAVRALGQSGIDAEVMVVIGPSVADADRLKKDLQESGCPVTLVENCTDLKPLMAETDLAVAAFGVTAYELAAMGVPAIHLCPTADHARSASAFARAGMAVNLGVLKHGTDKALAEAARGLLADEAARQRMATAGRSRLDGRGAMRLAALVGARLKREAVRPAA
jgi:spore coat polysaccharide biosynthesis protein SpsF